ncbi:hypothetical protein [Flavobacterium sp.]
MMEQLTTYRAKGKTIGLEFLFKYDLNGNLKEFQIVEGELNDEQMIWLFSSNFPATEGVIKKNWMKLDKYKKVFEIQISAADLSFEAFWNLYDYKVDKFQAKKYFDKLKENDVIILFNSIPEYRKFCQRKNVAVKYPSTYITQRSFLDDYKRL